MSKKIRLGYKNKLSNISNSLELPAGTLSGGAHIELYSNKTAVVDGCAGVIEYSSELIKLNIGKGTVAFMGKELNISFFDDAKIALYGEINNVEFCV